MPRLFYKDLKAHEKAYRDVRADEAVNDLILGSKVNKLRNLETAREKAIDQVAKNYGDFLKSLKVKNVELVNRANNAEKALDETLTQVFDIESKRKADKATKAAKAEEVAKAANDDKIIKAAKVAKAAKAAKDIGTNVLMPGQRPRSNTIASDAPTEFSEAPSTIPPYNKDMEDVLTLVGNIQNINQIPKKLLNAIGQEGINRVNEILGANNATLSPGRTPMNMHKAKKNEIMAAIRLYYADKSKRK